MKESGIGFCLFRNTPGVLSNFRHRFTTRTANSNVLCLRSFFTLLFSLHNSPFTLHPSPLRDLRPLRLRPRRRPANRGRAREPSPLAPRNRTSTLQKMYAATGRRAREKSVRQCKMTTIRTAREGMPNLHFAKVHFSIPVLHRIYTVFGRLCEVLENFVYDQSVWFYNVSHEVMSEPE